MSPAPSRSFLSSAAWVLGGRWTDRLIGLISTIILARLLVPSDFGVIVLATIVIGFIDTVFDLSVHISLIQNRSPSRDDFDTAWTLRLLQAIAATAVVLLIAGPAAEYFDDTRVEAVMQVLAIAIIFMGLENIGVVNFQRELRFKQDYWFFFIRRISGFAVALLLAWHLRSYWALVAGTVAGRAVGFVASYMLHPYRPRITLRSIKSMWRVSQWALVRNLASYMESRLDKLAIGRIAGSPAAGAYATAEEFALVPITEFLAPLGRALLPVFASASATAEALRITYLRALQLQCLIAIPAAIGIHCVAPELVVVLLGEKWLSAIPFLAVLALVALATVVTHAATYVFMATGRMALLAGLAIGQVVVMISLLLLTWTTTDASMIAWLRLIAASSVIPPILYFLLRAIPGLRLMDVGRALARPAIAGAVMYLTLLALFEEEIADPLAVLILKVIVGGVTYTTMVAVLWFAAGRPSSAESNALSVLRRLVAHRRKRE